MRAAERRGPHRALVALGAAVLIAGGCASETGRARSAPTDETGRTVTVAPRTTRAPTVVTTAALTTTTPLRLACERTGTCTLAEAGRAAGIVIGTAAKLGDPAREALQIAEFDALSSEDEFLWSVIHPAPDSWDFAPADALVAFAAEHGKTLTATHFVWDPPLLPDVLPAWVRAIDDPDELRRVLADHLAVLHERYAGRVARLDVVNEAIGAGGVPATNHFAEVLGDDYVAEAFALAAEQWPDVELVLNQDRTEYDPGAADALVALTSRLLASGRRVDRVGLQGHLLAGEPDHALIRSTMSRLGALGVAVELSEVDVPRRGGRGSGRPIDAIEQAGRAARLVTDCRTAGNCVAITFWGVDDGDTWLDEALGPGTDPLLYDADLRPKPMRAAVVDALLTGR